MIFIILIINAPIMIRLVRVWHRKEPNPYNISNFLRYNGGQFLTFLVEKYKISSYWMLASSKTLLNFCKTYCQIS